MLTSNTRLRVFSIVIVAILTSAIGLFTTYNTFSKDVRELDSSLIRLEDEISRNPNEAISAALLEVGKESLNVMLLVQSGDGSQSLLRDTTSGLYDALAQKKFTDTSITKPLDAQAADIRYRYISLKVFGGDLLILAVDTSEAFDALKSNLLLTVEVTLGLIVIATVLLTVYFRRVRRKDDADALIRMQEFLGDASHELRTPLTVIKGYVEMLSRDQIADEADKARAFARVGTEIKRMESLIHDLLLLAELGESAERETTAVDFSSLLRAHTNDFITLNPSREINVDIHDDLYVLGASDYLSRFIQNALTNISRHTPVGAPVAISLTVKAKKVCLIIEDGGPGLPEEKYKQTVRILNRFDKSRARENGGSGLGMSIMSAVIERLDGTLELRKSSLGGLAIEAELPLVPAHSE